MEVTWPGVQPAAWMVPGGDALVMLHGGALFRVRGQPRPGQTQNQIRDDMSAWMPLE